MKLPGSTVINNCLPVKLQYLRPLIQVANSLAKTLMLGKI